MKKTTKRWNSQAMCRPPQIEFPAPTDRYIWRQGAGKLSDLECPKWAVLGTAAEATFSKAFQRWIGVAPGTYRRGSADRAT